MDKIIKKKKKKRKNIFSVRSYFISLMIPRKLVLSFVAIGTHENLLSHLVFMQGNIIRSYNEKKYPPYDKRVIALLL